MLEHLREIIIIVLSCERSFFMQKSSSNFVLLIHGGTSYDVAGGNHISRLTLRVIYWICFEIRWTEATGGVYGFIVLLMLPKQ